MDLHAFSVRLECIPCTHASHEQLISAPNVKHALALYGADSLDKHSHFAELLGEYGQTESEEEEEVAEQSEDRKPVAPPAHRTRTREATPLADAEDPAADSPLQPLPVLRSIFPPFIYFPSSSAARGHASDPTLAAAYMPWPSSSLLATAPEPPTDDDLLPTTFDADAEEEELQEEDALDKEDQIVAARAQKALWDRVSASAGVDTGEQGRAVTSGDGGGERPVVARGRPPRKRKSPEEDGEDEGASRKSAEEGGSPEPKDAGESADADASAGPGAQGETEEAKVPPQTRGRPRKRYKTTRFMTQEQLMFTEPNKSSKIKSSVYVHSSDDE